MAQSLAVLNSRGPH